MCILQYWLIILFHLYHRDGLNFKITGLGVLYDFAFMFLYLVDKSSFKKAKREDNIRFVCFVPLRCAQEVAATR